MEIIPNLHLVPGVIAHPYLIVDADGLTLIDTGLALTWRRILRYITRIGHTPDSLRRIIVTHRDGDHAGGLAALTAASGARTYASAVEAEAIAAGHVPRDLNVSGMPRMLLRLSAPLFRVPPVLVDEHLTEGQVLPVLGGLQVLETPGHTPGHISLFTPSAGVLFAGDSIAHRGGKIRRPFSISTWNQERALESFRKQANLGASIICLGHGPVVREATGKFQFI